MELIFKELTFMELRTYSHGTYSHGTHFHGTDSHGTYFHVVEGTNVGILWSYTVKDTRESWKPTTTTLPHHALT